ncbi:hypothetical protein MRS44_003236 [Fusarium solani]|uniref:VPS9 domain-containing protein n=1 Tax=Fusarium solani TaxID=169388 RepID=A0A9P9L216_FUSSL|nr:uncharacterized protein B0J15DRAFT_387822 [Fusarium solani]KAH7272731.1 hypothetical protein B0J15DRAFT_387822 [Fusarium solani]KAJ3469171.1 hypothetical protein MRS44_003236 [Fusarium solani]
MIVYSSGQRFMASRSPSDGASARPSVPRTSTFSQVPKTPASDGDDHLQVPKRAHTFANASPSGSPDAFESGDHDDTDDVLETGRASIELDILPIELITLTDSFIDSLNAKVHPTPPNIERLSQKFQEFYSQASSNINTHINALASRQSRDVSPTPSSSSISSAASRLRSRASALNVKEKTKSEAEQQMITADELAQRKRARKALEAKRVLLEEAVERRLCEGIYDKIYQHRSTQDEAQDDKLRSKTAALALVGIGPADLGINLNEVAVASGETTGPTEEDIKEKLEPARRDLVMMSQKRYPLGKLNHLKAAHRSIVDTLAHFHPSASADEIMPMLIYTLITLPPENLHVISDVHFVQNFRWEPKLTGEAAYCLTNLEAAISFLETVDLATLRADEQLSGPAKSSSSPRSGTFPPAYPQGPAAASPSDPETNKTNAAATKPTPSALKASTNLRNRRLSDLVNAPAQAFGAASDAVFSSADQSLKNISNSLGDSYKFLVGKLREHQDSPRESILVPKTLDDARKLVSTPSPDEEDTSGINTLLGPDDADPLKRPTQREDRMLNLIGGRRDRSTDSTRSGRSVSSSKKVLFSSEETKTAPQPSPGQNPAVLEQMRNLGNTFNPMARLPSISMIRGFGRNASSTPTTPAATPAAKEVPKPADGGDLGTAFPDIAAALPPKEIPKIAPPNKRFMEIQTPGELRLGEVLDLLRDYRRLAGALKDLGAFETK